MFLLVMLVFMLLHVSAYIFIHHHNMTAIVMLHNAACYHCLMISYMIMVTIHSYIAIAIPS